MAAPGLSCASPPRPVEADPAANQAVDRLLLCAVLVVSMLGLWWMLGSQVVRLWSLWTGNGLASIGMLMPVAAVILTVRAWRARPWERRGTWWGLVICAVALLLARLDRADLIPLVAYHVARLPVFPVGAQVFLYVTGVVLLFAGLRFYRAALFPICLLFFLNPAPEFFTSMVDLPLQQAGAHTARAFAHWVGVPLTGDDLRMMFSPALGMFIAPGCNGMRGSLAMGFLTAVVGHLYGLPWLLRSAYVASGVLVAYLLNLVRLCGLVLCYRLALGFAPLARHMNAADYALGSTLFFIAALFVFAIPGRWKRLSKQHAG